MKTYTKPEMKIIHTENQLLNTASTKTQCDCETYRLHQGCQGCPGNCGCNVWDSETGELIPGC